MFIVLLCLALKMITVDCRVHCWDSLATHYIPLGYACPVNCANVISAINRLKIIDIEKIMSVDKSYENAVNSMEHYIEKLTIMRQEKIGKDVRISYNGNTNPTHAAILNDTYNEIKHKMADKRRYFENGRCYRFLLAADKAGLKKCIAAKNGIDVDETIGIISETLSKYTNSNVSWDTTKKLMVTMLGADDLEAGKFELKAVVKYLSHAFHAYEDLKRVHIVIQLRSQHCLTTYVPGCFCQAGYVERFGRCIKPAKCYVDKSNDKYMSRIIVL